jgi:hypothetical protein
MIRIGNKVICIDKYLIDKGEFTECVEYSIGAMIEDSIPTGKNIFVIINDKAEVRNYYESFFIKSDLLYFRKQKIQKLQKRLILNRC